MAWWRGFLLEISMKEFLFPEKFVDKKIIRKWQKLLGMRLKSGFQSRYST
jgi:hypothetical protein